MTTGSGAFDALNMFTTAVTVSRGTTYAANAIKIRGTPAKGLGVRIQIPCWPATTCTMLPQIYASEDNSTYRLASSYPGGHISAAANAAVEVQFAFAVRRKYQYVKLYFAFASGTTGDDLGLVQAGIVAPGAYSDWSREAQWT
jgi:hypothetical protein